VNPSEAVIPSRKIPSHYGFSDESHYTHGRYRGVAMVSLAAPDHARFSEELAVILNGCGLKEFKWTDLSSAQHRFAALKMIEWVFPKLLQQSIRIDVLIWDTSDSRHKIEGRDDLANLSRMYYHLFKNVLRERWPNESLWMIYPDENSAINWMEIDSFLSYAGMTVEMQRHLSETNKWKLRIKTEFSIHRILPCRSHEHVFVQLADLVVGLAIYSRTHYVRYEQWHNNSGGQSCFEFKSESEIQLSRSDRERCKVLGDLDQRCKESKLGVSLKSFKGLRSPKAISALNFWWYEPQIEADKAPTTKTLSPNKSGAGAA
jgi:hypothetical protein